MGIEIAIGETTLNDTATVDFTSSILSAAPVGILAIMTDGDTPGTANADWRMSMGSTDGTRQAASVAESADGGAASNTSRQSYTSVTGRRQPGTGASRDSIDHNSFLSNGWRANHTDRGDTGKLVTAIMFGGSDVTLESGSFTPSGTSEITESFVNTSLFPNVIIFYSVGSTVVQDKISDLLYSFGMAVFDGVTLQQRSWNIFHNDAEATAAPEAILDTTHAVTQKNLWKIAVNSLNVGNFKCTPTVDPVSDLVGYLAIQFDNANLALIDVDLPTSTGLNDEIGPGFTPKFVMQISGMLSAVDTDTTDATAGVFNIGMFNATEAKSYSWAEEHGEETMDNQSLTENFPVKYPEDDGAIQAFAATFDSFTENGYQLNYSDIDGTIRKGFALAIGEAPAGNFMPASHSTVWVRR